MANKVLVVAVHPDDETIGCGGTILKHKANGDEVSWLTITAVNDDSGYSKEVQEKRQLELKEVAKAYNFDHVFHLDFATTRLEEYSKNELYKEISQVIKSTEVEIIYVQFPGDVHSEHGAAFEMVYGCTKSFRFPHVKEVYAMETLSETEFAPPFIQNTFIPNTFVAKSK